MKPWSPLLALSCAAVACFVLIWVAVTAAVAAPWMGASFEARPDFNAILLDHVALAGPSARVPAPAKVISVAAADGAGRRTLSAMDRVEEPDLLDNTDTLKAFFARQGEIYALLETGQVRLEVQRGAEASQTYLIKPGDRPLGDLPGEFWLQLVVGAGGLLIGAWVWSMKPSDWSARLFALSGVGLMLSAFSAAIYSSRELALPETFFRVLSIGNHVGTPVFGCAMIGLFLIYPRRLAPPIALLAAPLVFGAWMAAYEFGLIYSQATGLYVPMATQIVVILVLVAVQWWMSRGDPRARAALQWLGLLVAIGAGAFVLAQAGPAMFGTTPVVSQGVAFGFFLPIYGGIALGLRRYRLFDLNEWSFRMLFYTGGALAFLGVDAALVFLVRLQSGLAVGLALLVGAFVYLPLRDVLWRRFIVRRRFQDHELFHAVIEIAFTEPGRRADRWRALLARLYDPLQIEEADPPATQAEARNDGLELALPPGAGAPSLVLRYPWKGSGLFGPAHLQMARQLAALIDHAEASREAYERGASEERRRIAQDLHDDVGARLLSGLHTADRRTRPVLHAALEDIRTIVSGLTGDHRPMSRVLAELRHETVRRLEAVGISLDWPLSEIDEDDAPLDYRVYKNLASAVREVVSNVIRHSQATAVAVVIERQPDQVVITVTDNGKGLSLEAAALRAPGNGLRNLARRLTDIGGEISFPATPKGLSVCLAAPLRLDQPVLNLRPTHP